MTSYMLYALVAFFVGVIIKKYMNVAVGEVIEVISAILFILFWFLSAFHTG
jgi:ABC-type Mn2+/Zn2+ transport system permease subunit